AERLSRFTPQGAGLDRDGLLFAAGRASARPNRWWVALTALLALSQTLTLVCLWPRPVPPAARPTIEPGPAEPAPAPPYQGAEPLAAAAEPWALHRQWLGSDKELPPPPRARALVPDHPPLRAFTVSAPLPTD